MRHGNWAIVSMCPSNCSNKWGGMNEHGRTIYREMNRLGMLINVAHASDDAIIQAAEAKLSSYCIYPWGISGLRLIEN